MSDQRPESETLAARLGCSPPVVVGVFLAVLWLLNIADYVLTLRSLSLGHAIELNGAMARLYELGSLPAAVVKIGVVTVGVLLLWRLRAHNWVLIGAAALTLLFTALVTFELLAAASL